MSHPFLPAPAAEVIDALLRHAEDFCPSYKQIGERCCPPRSARAVREQMTWLAAEGIVEKFRLDATKFRWTINQPALNAWQAPSTPTPSMQRVERRQHPRGPRPPLQPKPSKKNASTASSQQLYKKSRSYYLLTHAKYRAARQQVPYDLDQHAAEVMARIDNGRCELSGIEFYRGGGLHGASPSIDRIVPSKGYVHDNIRVICWAINAAMGRWGEAATKEIMAAWLAGGAP